MISLCSVKKLFSWNTIDVISPLDLNNVKLFSPLGHKSIGSLAQRTKT